MNDAFKVKMQTQPGTEMLLKGLHEAIGNYFAGNRWPCLLVHMPFLINILYDFL